mmetsp:Transcript_103837/g.318030  ORF Transcript_103837/g.318030 Transcript_103837/m.318030 type:complete len:304 (+) Transcript_103837:559-1470(+)
MRVPGGQQGVQQRLLQPARPGVLAALEVLGLHADRPQGGDAGARGLQPRRAHRGQGARAGRAGEAQGPEGEGGDHREAQGRVPRLHRGLVRGAVRPRGGARKRHSADVLPAAQGGLPGAARRGRQEPPRLDGGQKRRPRQEGSGIREGCHRRRKRKRGRDLPDGAGFQEPQEEGPGPDRQGGRQRPQARDGGHDPAASRAAAGPGEPLAGQRGAAAGEHLRGDLRLRGEDQRDRQGDVRESGRVLQAPGRSGEGVLHGPDGGLEQRDRVLLPESGHQHTGQRYEQGQIPHEQGRDGAGLRQFQ